MTIEYISPGFLVDSVTKQSELCPITHWPFEVVILRFTSDSSPLADVNNEPWITRGSRVESSVDFSVKMIGILSSAILLNFSIIFFDIVVVASGVGVPITSDSSTTKNCFSNSPKWVSTTIVYNPKTESEGNL